jgi:hypothetical protein
VAVDHSTATFSLILLACVTGSRLIHGVSNAVNPQTVG